MNKKSSRGTWLKSSDYDYGLVLYHENKLLEKTKQTEIRISNNRLKKFYSLTNRHDHFSIARLYGGHLHNLTSIQSQDQMIYLNNKYNDIPTSWRESVKGRLFFENAGKAKKNKKHNWLVY